MRVNNFVKMGVAKSGARTNRKRATPTSGFLQHLWGVSLTQREREREGGSGDTLARSRLYSSNKKKLTQAGGWSTPRDVCS